MESIKISVKLEDAAGHQSQETSGVSMQRRSRLLNYK